MYTEASYKRNGSVARLTSGLIPTTYEGTGCLRFSYHMYGADIGILTVSVKYANGNTLSTWTKQG